MKKNKTIIILIITIIIIILISLGIYIKINKEPLNDIDIEKQLNSLHSNKYTNEALEKFLDYYTTNKEEINSLSTIPFEKVFSTQEKCQGKIEVNNNSYYFDSSCEDDNKQNSLKLNYNLNMKAKAVSDSSSVQFFEVNNDFLVYDMNQQEGNSFSIFKYDQKGNLIWTIEKNLSDELREKGISAVLDSIDYMGASTFDGYIQILLSGYYYDEEKEETINFPIVIKVTDSGIIENIQIYPDYYLYESLGYKDNFVVISYTLESESSNYKEFVAYIDEVGKIKNLYQVNTVLSYSYFYDEKTYSFAYAYNDEYYQNIKIFNRLGKQIDEIDLPKLLDKKINFVEQFSVKEDKAAFIGATDDETYLFIIDISNKKLLKKIKLNNDLYITNVFFDEIGINLLCQEESTFYLYNYDNIDYNASKVKIVDSDNLAYINNQFISISPIYVDENQYNLIEIYHIND